jgi:hypothetical protein
VNVFTNCSQTKAITIGGEEMKKFIMMISIVLFVLPLSTLAEKKDTTLIMEELSIQVMPEYSYHPKDTKKNHPPLLVGYQGTFRNPSSQALKGKVEIPLPTNLKDIQVGFVADYSSNLSEMYEIEYVLDKERGTISWETTNDIQPNDLYKFVVEFYSSEIKTRNEEKRFTYSFESFTDIGLVNITYLEPLKTESTKLDPPPETHQENPYGMNMFMYQFGGLNTGDKKVLEVQYKRSNTRTTVEIMNQIAPIQEDQPIKPKKVESNLLLMVIGGVGAFSLLASFILILWLKKRNKVTIQPTLNGEMPHNQNDEKALLRAKLVQGEITKKEYDERIQKMILK